jgi:putative FmdB family regulatory protein
MPTYDYECSKCGQSFEVFQKITDSPLKRCPSCKGKLKRLIGAGCGLIFKGTGFYITDYKRKNESSKEKEVGSKDKKEDKKPSSKAQ